jgi:signal transduction histidine kinase/ActR/RegA family two-component response regulator
MSKQQFFKPFVIFVVALAAAVAVFCVARLNVAQFDSRFLILALISIFIGARLIVHIPAIQGEITVADTLIFLTILLYGGEAATLLAGMATLATSIRISKKISVLLFNSAVMTCATFVTFQVLRLCFGPVELLSSKSQSAIFVSSLCLMASVQYVVNTALVTVYTACKIGRSFWETWRTNYLWASITYFAGASAAFIIAKLMVVIGFYALIVTLPIIAIVYLTYRTYLKNVEASAERAEQARKHVEELSRYIAEQERLQEQFSQLEKMSALGQLASGVAHDFNNTLAGILGRAELMLRRSSDPETERGLNIIIKAAGDGAQTVKRIQDFARQRQDHDFALVAVDQLLTDVNEITRPRWKDVSQAQNIHVELNLQANSDAVIRGDACELREVFVNMVFNAVDAMPGGGRIALGAEKRDGFVEISISDNGMGMSADVKSRIFDPFFTTKGNGGMGLGLAVCYGIIQRHGGTVEVESEPDAGTSFIIKFPLEEVLASEDVVTGKNPHLKLVSQIPLPRILVVDDEPSVRELLGDILEGEGYEVSLASNGTEALELFDAHAFGAVFTDLGMPGMSGWELARAIRERSSDIPLAVVTGWGEAVGSDEQQEAKVDWIVAKPFSITRICEIAGEVSSRQNNAASSQLLAATGT